MSFKQAEYIHKTSGKPHRDILAKALATLVQRKFNVAIDCGCGSGNDTEFLLDQGFYVYGFDAETAAIETCQKRFSKNSHLSLSHASFENFQYPQADIINASRSLFFCTQKNLHSVWRKVSSALPKGGVFCGDFLGNKDEWLTTGRPVSYVMRPELEKMLSAFEIVDYKELQQQGTTINGRPKYWHIHTLIAIKR